MLFKKDQNIKKDKNSLKMNNKDYERLGKYMKEIYETAYTSKKRLFYVSFVKGIGQGFGIFIGGTIVVAIVFWVLGIFDDTFLSPIVQKIYNAINIAEYKQQRSL